MKKYKYSQLSKKSQANAREDYQNGWSETHDEILSDSELHDLCLDSDNDVLFNKNGNVITEKKRKMSLSERLMYNLDGK